MKALLFRPASWPLTLKVPVVVALLMIAVSVVFTNEVLRRLTESQARSLRAVANVYLDGLSSAIVPAVLRADTWEVFDALDRFSGVEAGFGKVTTLVAGADGVVIAASDPRAVRVQSRIPGDVVALFSPGNDMVVDPARRRADVRRDLVYQGRPIGAIYARIDIGAQLLERRNVLVTLLLTNGALAALLAGLGYFAVRRMIAPLHVLTTHLDDGVLGSVRPIPQLAMGHPHSEFGRLFRRFNALVAAVNEREVLANQLAAEERLASLGHLASGVAHEINNPLGGLFNALDTLKRHGEAPLVRERTLNLLERGLSNIRDVVRATLVTYRADASGRLLHFADIEDLRLLIEPEAKRKNVRLVWNNHVPDEIGTAAGAVCQAMLNLLLNACAAAPADSTVSLRANVNNARLTVEVEDEGAGLAAHLGALLEAPAPSAAPVGSGLGLWIVRRLIFQLDGTVRVRSGPTGTAILCDIPVGSNGDATGRESSSPASPLQHERVDHVS